MTAVTQQEIESCWGRSQIQLELPQAKITSAAVLRCAALRWMRRLVALHKEIMWAILGMRLPGDAQERIRSGLGWYARTRKELVITF